MVDKFIGDCVMVLFGAPLPMKAEEQVLRAVGCMREAVEKGVEFDKLRGLKSREAIARMATVPNEEWQKRFKQIEEEMEKEMEKLYKS